MASPVASSLASTPASGAPDPESAHLLRELDAAEAYAQQLRQVIVDVKNELAAGHHQRALSMLNEALNDIDAQTDVVVPHKDG